MDNSVCYCRCFGSTLVSSMDTIEGDGDLKYDSLSFIFG